MGMREKTLVRRTHRFWHLVFFAVALGLVFVVLRGLGTVLTPVAAALVLAYLLDPIVDWAERRLRMPRWLGTLVLFLLAIALVTLGVLLLLPVVFHELQAFAEAVPGYAAKIRDVVVPWVEQTLHVRLPRSLTELSAKIGTDMQTMTAKILGPLGGVAGRVAAQTGVVFSTLGTLALIPVFTFYFLPNFGGLVGGARELIPHRYRPWVDDTAREIDRTLASWIRGQITVMLVLAALYAIGLSFVGLKMAVLIGLFTGLLAFIPYVGFALGLVIAIIVCLLEYQGIGQLVGVVLVFTSVQIVDGIFLTPRIVGEKAGLGPVGVLLALMLGGNLFGFIGVLLAVPVAAALVVVLRRGVSAYRKSLFFRKGMPEHAITECDESPAGVPVGSSGSLPIESTETADDGHEPAGE